MKKVFLVLVILATGISAYGYYTFWATEFVPEASTVGVTRGDIVDTVGATGALEAVTTVQVGSQVSGIIEQLYVDYNSIVRAGDIVMRLDPSLFETQVEQARANLVRAEADLERQRVTVDDASTQLARAEDLAARSLISDTELEAAQVTLRSAEAQVKSFEAQVIQAQASLNQNEVNLEHTVIRAPIDGIVISRLVDVGQTVAASLQAPELFVIAADLTKMRVIANIDESDVGRIRPGQRVRFTVDAYPAEEFEGTVSQIRLESVVQQNVVTYATVVDAPNHDLKLKPGMTATITLEIARQNDTMRIPNAALRFRPTAEMFVALNQPVPEFLQPGGGGGAPGGPSGRPTSDVTAGGGPLGGQGFGGTGGGFGGGAPDPERMRQFQQRLQQMSPEEREQFMAQRRAGRGRGAGGFGDSGGVPHQQANASDAPTIPTVGRGATTIDALFGPLPATESTGRVWVMEGGQLQAVNVRLGVTDGTATELLGAVGSAGRPSRPRENDQLAMFRQRLENLEDASVRVTLERLIEQVEARQDEPSGFPVTQVASGAPSGQLQAGTQLVTNISTPDNGSTTSSGVSGSPLIPQFRRR